MFVKTNSRWAGKIEKNAAGEILCASSIPALRVVFEQGLPGQFSEVACHIALENPHIGTVLLMRALIKIQCFSWHLFYISWYLLFC